jgi:hypothetical protein
MKIRELSIKAEKSARQLIQEMKAGKIQKLNWSDELIKDLRSERTTLQEMVGTDDGAAEFLEKITYDVFLGQEEAPLQYKDIFYTQSDPNFPKTMLMHEFGPTEMVFLEKLEGGEVKFGALGPGIDKVVSFVTYAAGIEYDEDVIEYNQTWRISDINREFGIEYNKLLNHIHLSPIINGTYVQTTSFQGATGITAQRYAQRGNLELNSGWIAQDIPFDTDIATTLTHALQVLPQVTIVLANPADQYRLEDAISGAMLVDASASIVKRSLDPSKFIYYDTHWSTVRNKTYTYAGVPAGQVFLIAGGITGGTRNFQELIKHDLRVDSGDGDLSRLILSQVVGRARRAVSVILGGAGGAVKVHLE